MEKLASEWGRQDLAVGCRKYQAIILDEYGNDKTLHCLFSMKG